MAMWLCFKAFREVTHRHSLEFHGEYRDEEEVDYEYYGSGPAPFKDFRKRAWRHFILDFNTLKKSRYREKRRAAREAHDHSSCLLFAEPSIFNGSTRTMSD